MSWVNSTDRLRGNITHHRLGGGEVRLRPQGTGSRYWRTGRISPIGARAQAVREPSAQPPLDTARRNGDHLGLHRVVEGLLQQSSQHVDKGVGLLGPVDVYTPQYLPASGRLDTWGQASPTEEERVVGKNLLRELT